MLRLGLIGPGDIGAYLGKLSSEIDGVQVVAVAGRNPNKTQEYAKSLGAIPFFDYQAMLAEANLDAIIVATPSDTHHRIVLEAIEHGIHVFCEKPMALSVADCDEMISAADHKGIKLMVGHVLREMPVFKKTREILASKELGRPLLVDIIRAEKMELWGWYIDKDRFRSAFHEMSVHEFDFLRKLLGDLQEVSVKAVRRDGHDLNYDTPVQVHLEFTNSTQATLTQYGNSPLTIGIGFIFCENGTLLYNWRDGNRIEYQIQGGDKISLEIQETEANNAYRRELTSFVNWIQADIPPLMTAQDGRAAVEIAEAAYLSRQSGQPVKLPLVNTI